MNTEIKPKRPPSDRGQGRKPKPPEERLIGKSVRLTQEGWQQFDELGGSEWLRPTVAAAHKKLKGKQMTTHKVSELEGKLLDAAVAKAIGLTAEMALEFWLGCPDWLTAFKPSQSWLHGGPIIERERITVQASQAGDWRAFSGDGTTNAGTGRAPSEQIPQARGDTPLIAAMRSLVASKFGDTIELED